MTGRKGSGWLLAAVLSAAGGVLLAGGGLLWALFFSVGTRGGSTSEMIRYNLQDPVLTLFAYGPLALGVLALLAAVGFAVAWRVKRRG